MLYYNRGYCDNYFIFQVQAKFTLYTPFAVHYEEIRIHLRKTAINSAKIHSLVRWPVSDILSKVKKVH